MSANTASFDLTMFGPKTMAKLLSCIWFTDEFCLILSINANKNFIIFLLWSGNVTIISRTFSKSHGFSNKLEYASNVVNGSGNSLKNAFNIPATQWTSSSLFGINWIASPLSKAILIWFILSPPPDNLKIPVIFNPFASKYLTHVSKQSGISFSFFFQFWKRYSKDFSFWTSSFIWI